MATWHSPAADDLTTHIQADSCQTATITAAQASRPPSLHTMRLSPSSPIDSHTLRNVRRDFPEWHMGRTHYALWALQVDTQAVRQRMRAAQQHLANRLLQGYERQPHITLGLCGFLSEAPQHTDDFGAQALRLQLAALRQTNLTPFDIYIGGLASFSSAPYLTVQAAPASMESLRQCVAGAAMNPPAAHYTPHLTVGLYAGVWPLADLQEQFKDFAQSSALQLLITRLALLSYAAQEIGGSLQTLAEYDFQSRLLHWNPVDAPWARSFRDVV